MPVRRGRRATRADVRCPCSGWTPALPVLSDGAPSADSVYSRSRTPQAAHMSRSRLSRINGVPRCPGRDIITIRRRSSGMGCTVPGMTEIGTDWRAVDGVASGWFDAPPPTAGAAPARRLPPSGPRPAVTGSGCSAPSPSPCSPSSAPQGKASVMIAISEPAPPAAEPTRCSARDACSTSSSPPCQNTRCDP